MIPPPLPEISFLCMCLPVKLPTEELKEELKIELKKYIAMTKVTTD